MAAQEEAGLDLLSDGLLRWQDLFRPLAEASEGLDARPLSRFLDTNTFYRALIVDGEPRLAAPLPAPKLPPGKWLATLPSPHALSRAANGAVEPRRIAANVLAPQIDSYAAAGCALVVLSDPFLLGDSSLFERGAAEVSAALSELPQGVPFVLQLPFGNASGRLEAMADLPVAGIGVDFYATGLDAVPENYPREIVAGVIDSRSSAVEDAGEIAAFTEQLRERRSAGLSLSVNGDLQFVPGRIAREKLLLLGRVRAEVEEGVRA